MPELVHFAVADAVATITLDSQHNRNALSRQLVTELFEGLERAAGDPAVKVVLVSAEGRVLLRCRSLRGDDRGHGGRCSAHRRPPAVDRDDGQAGRDPGAGAVRAGGIGIVAASDIAIAADDATFALTEVKLGLAAAIISSSSTTGCRRAPPR